MGRGQVSRRENEEREVLVLYLDDNLSTFFAETHVAIYSCSVIIVYLII